ncbi:hypothetical protein LguiA_007833 [Lonicera macranthoides]
MRIVTLEEGMTIVEKGIAKATMIMDGYPSYELFTSEEYMMVYHCVYTMCVQHPPHDYSQQLYERFKRALEETICAKVLPSLMDKNSTPLLIQLLHMWAKYKAMTKCLRGFFTYLDRHYSNNFRNGTIELSLNDLSVQCFHDLIREDRDEKATDRDLLNNVSNFLVEIERGNRLYYDDFEKAILEDAAIFYSQLASEWLFRYSSADYILKAKWCLDAEKERAIHYLYLVTLEKLLKVVHWQMVVQAESKLIEKQKAENNSGSATFQELLLQCANLSLGEGTSASRSQECNMLE